MIPFLQHKASNRMGDNNSPATILPAALTNVGGNVVCAASLLKLRTPSCDRLSLSTKTRAVHERSDPLLPCEDSKRRGGRYLVDAALRQTCPPLETVKLPQRPAANLQILNVHETDITEQLDLWQARPVIAGWFMHRCSGADARTAEHSMLQQRPHDFDKE